MQKIKELMEKYREILLYLIFGVLTTAVNYVSWWILTFFFDTSTVPVAAAWLLSVLFAYVTNRIFVFRSDAHGTKEVCREVGSFMAARILSGVMDMVIMWVFADWLGLNSKIVKLVSNVFVVVFNYVASRLVIFRRQK